MEGERKVGGERERERERKDQVLQLVRWSVWFLLFNL